MRIPIIRSSNKLWIEHIYDVCQSFEESFQFRSINSGLFWKSWKKKFFLHSVNNFLISFDYLCLPIPTIFDQNSTTIRDILHFFRRIRQNNNDILFIEMKTSRWTWDMIAPYCCIITSQMPTENVLFLK